MKQYSLNQVQFLKTAIWPKDYPETNKDEGGLIPEIGVVGRSNVGKSSLLNHLFKSKNLVKTSSKPGKTQALNFFTANGLITFVDLPGYGYAKVPEKIKKMWAPMIQNYLEERKHLCLLLFLLDIRRTPNANDMLFLKWARFYKVPLIIIFTKTDKLKTGEKNQNTKKIFSMLGDAYSFPYVHYSTTKNIGRAQLTSMISQSLSQKNKEHHSSSSHRGYNGIAE